MAQQAPLCPTRAPLSSTTNFLYQAWFLLLTASSAIAQSLPIAPETTTFPSSLTPSSSGIPASITSSIDTRTHITLSRSATASNATAHNSSSTSTRSGNLALGPANGDAMQTGDQQSGGGGLLNYYFAFLAVFIVIILAGVWYIHRRKRRLKALRASSRQTALSRDLDGWAGGRRWVGGAFRGGLRRQHERQQSREEGLNELGEAPPPYKARDSVVSGEDVATTGRRRDLPDDADDPEPSEPREPTIPLRTLGRDGRTAGKPPDYHETVREVSHEEGESSSTGQRQAFARSNTQDHTNQGR